MKTVRFLKLMGTTNLHQLINKVMTILFNIEGYRKNVVKIAQLAKIEICAVLFFEDSKDITLSSKYIVLMILR